MDIHQFQEVVRTFLDSPDQFDSGKGDFVLQIGSELFSGYTEMRGGSLFVREGDLKTSAEDWIINRVAMLPLLADRIIANTKPLRAYVKPKALFLPDINTDSGDNSVEPVDAASTIYDFLDRRPGGTCSALYLTSDAGEGKTTTIAEVARKQAIRFKNRETDWLLVPINLGGKPFLRFDDIVVAALMNQLRFQRLYFDSFMQLVRMGFLVPALDGFEEIFVENAEGDAISSLGSLIHQLRGQGSLLIAARKAYFEFQSLKNQAKLLDGLRGADVSFGRVALCRWTEDEFTEYAELNGVSRADAGKVHESISTILGIDHPLVTRPVLVRRVIEIINDSGTGFLSELRPQANSYFAWLVDTILTREAQEKWLDKYGEPPKPLLSIAEHHEMLDYIAEEMWTSKSAVLSGEMLESLAEIYCESKALPIVISRQVRERVKQHALIVNTSVGAREFMFDHENFQDFFLGEQLARHLLGKSEDDLRRVFRADLLPSLVQEIAVQKVTEGGRDASEVIQTVLRVALSEGSSSYVRENGGLLIAPLLECSHSNPMNIAGMVFPPDCTAGRRLVSVCFDKCYFRPTSLRGATFSDCSFSNCEFEELTIEGDAAPVDSASFRDCRIHCLRIERGEASPEYYEPDEIFALLAQFGFSVDLDTKPISEIRTSVVEEDLRIMRKALQAFYRSTTIFENIFRRRLSLDAARFFNTLLPQLLKAGVFEEVSITAATKYRLGVPLSEISRAMSECDGSFKRFLELI